MRSVCGTHLAAKASTPDLACFIDHPKSSRPAMPRSVESRSSWSTAAAAHVSPGALIRNGHNREIVSTEATHSQRIDCVRVQTTSRARKPTRDASLDIVRWNPFRRRSDVCAFDIGKESRLWICNSASVKH
jgi:hypothetical protein